MEDRGGDIWTFPRWRPAGGTNRGVAMTPAIRGCKSAQPLPPLAVLREHLALDPGAPSGLRWIKRAQGRRLDGRAGAKKPEGYWTIGLLGQRLQVHRVVWALAKGVDPFPWEVDHIDNNPSNNSPGNLRLAREGSNSANSRARRGGSSLYKGVTLHYTQRKSGRARRWFACITPNGRQVCIGLYATEREAAAAYNRAAFAEWGSFARLNDLDAPGETISAKDLTPELRERLGLPASPASERSVAS